MRLLPAIIVAVALLLAPVIWIFVPRLLSDPSAAGQVGANGMAIDSGARIDIEMLRQQVEELGVQIETLSGRIQEVANRPAPAPMTAPATAAQPGGLQPLQQDGTNSIIDAYAQVVLIADRKNVNHGLNIASPSFLAQTFGLPREDLTSDCQPMTNPRLASQLVVQTVGPVRVQMLQPAIDSLGVVLENVRTTDPDLYARLNTAGSLCVRLIRGSTNSASTHSYGLAVDLNVDGDLDVLGDDRTQLGLTILADFFRDEGWIWGAAWGREDSMHFEVSRDKLEQWLSEGKI